MIFNLHKEGKVFITISLIFLIVLIASTIIFNHWILKLITLIAAIEFLFLANFFRNPTRIIPTKDDALLYAPADGKVVTIEQTFNQQISDGPVTQVSIFMSPLNVHVNRYPTTGKVFQSLYKPGKYLVAWHPKSSEENEQQVIVLDTTSGRIGIKQIAGAVARRIVCYAKTGMDVQQGSELGFIKFGSRVDLLLPSNTEILVKEGETVRGNMSVIARFI